MSDTETVIAPDFTLPVAGLDGAETVTLSALRGAPVVLFFYPRDNTPGCTAENLDFTARAAEFAAAGCTLFGMSKDSMASHEKFMGKKALSVPLISDEHGTACEDFGVWVEKKMYGKTFMGIERATFLIDAEGRVARAWRKVKVKGHADEVLEAVRAL